MLAACYLSVLFKKERSGNDKDFHCLCECLKQFRSVNIKIPQVIYKIEFISSKYFL